METETGRGYIFTIGLSALVVVLLLVGYATRDDLGEVVRRCALGLAFISALVPPYCIYALRRLGETAMTTKLEAYKSKMENGHEDL